MPPPKAKPLTAKDKDAIAGWVNHALESIGEPGDPGQVTMRRLTNAEYDYTVRDLTGQNFGFGQGVPVRRRRRRRILQHG